MLHSRTACFKSPLMRTDIKLINDNVKCNICQLLMQLCIMLLQKCLYLFTMSIIPQKITIIHVPSSVYKEHILKCIRDIYKSHGPEIENFSDCMMSALDSSMTVTRKFYY